MKINFENFELNEFLIKESIFCGVPAVLIQPNHIGTKFTKQNSIFRSSVWDKDGNLLSAGLKKFVNFGENPDNFPVPLNINSCQFIEKIDGSCCIIDYVNDQISMRTRGTFSYETMENKEDFIYCLSKYPAMSKWIKNNSNYSLICEITTPNLKIVVDYGDEPEFWLIGAINKNDYTLMDQHSLDKLGLELGLRRPNSYTFNSIEELQTEINSWKNKEGICLYSNKSQEIHKLKAETYLKLHRFKENATLENTLNLYFEYGKPSYNDFEKQLQSQFDYECFVMVKGFVSSIIDANKEVQKIIAGMQSFIDNNIKSLTNRKEQALKILSSYGTGSNRSGMVFTLLDGKSLTKDQELKLFWQVMKK